MSVKCCDFIAELQKSSMEDFSKTRPLSEHRIFTLQLSELWNGSSLKLCMTALLPIDSVHATEKMEPAVLCNAEMQLLLIQQSKFIFLFKINL